MTGEKLLRQKGKPYKKGKKITADVPESNNRLAHNTQPVNSYFINRYWNLQLKDVEWSNGFKKQTNKYLLMRDMISKDKSWKLKRYKSILYIDGIQNEAGATTLT